VDLSFAQSLQKQSMKATQYIADCSNVLLRNWIVDIPRPPPKPSNMNSGNRFHSSSPNTTFCSKAVAPENINDKSLIFEDILGNIPIEHRRSPEHVYMSVTLETFIGNIAIERRRSIEHRRILLTEETHSEISPLERGCFSEHITHAGDEETFHLEISPLRRARGTLNPCW
jgi:hypothetical protein